MAENAKSTVAVYPGSFDPITMGHVDLIQRLAGHYKELVVLVANSTAKSHLFSAQERKDLIMASLEGLSGVKVDDFDGLTVDYARRVGAKVILRGLRAVADFEYEFAMANMNRKLSPEVETMIVFTRPEYSFVSSRTVKEVAFFGGALEGLVTPVVARALRLKVSEAKV